MAIGKLLGEVWAWGLGWAAARASATRAVGAKVCRPGRSTSPTTATITDMGALAVVAATDAGTRGTVACEESRAPAVGLAGDGAQKCHAINPTPTKAQSMATPIAAGGVMANRKGRLLGKSTLRVSSTPVGWVRSWRRALTVVAFTGSTLWRGSTPPLGVMRCCG